MARTRPKPAPAAPTVPVVPCVPVELREAFIVSLYVRCLEREPEDGAVESWLPYFGPNGEPAKLIVGIAQGPEAKGVQVRRIYLELLDREPIQVEVDFWVRSPHDVMVIRGLLIAQADYIARCETLSEGWDDEEEPTPGPPGA